MLQNGKNAPAEASLYPISQVIAKMIMNSGYLPYGFLLAMGHPDAEAALPDLESWLEKGEGNESMIAQIAAFDPDQAEKLQKAAAETNAMKAAGVDPVALDRSRRLQEEQDRFRPFIRAQGEDTIPNGITIFGLTGGHERWTTLRIPADTLKLPLEEQLAKLPELMGQYRQEYKGSCPFFGKLTGFTFVRWSDYFEFDAEGRFLEHVEKPFGYAKCWAEL